MSPMSGRQVHLLLCQVLKHTGAWLAPTAEQTALLTRPQRAGRLLLTSPTQKFQMVAESCLDTCAASPRSAMSTQPLQDCLVEQLHCRPLAPRHSRSGGHTAALPGGPLRLRPRTCLSARHSRSGEHTAALPGGPVWLQSHTCLSPMDSRSGGHTAALPDAPLWLQPRTCLSSSRSHSGGHTAALPGGRYMRQLHRDPYPRDNSAHMPTGAQPSGLLLLPLCICAGHEQRPAVLTTELCSDGLLWLRRC